MPLETAAARSGRKGLTRQGLRPISVNLTETESDALPFRFGQAFCNFMPIAESLL